MLLSAVTPLPKSDVIPDLQMREHPATTSQHNVTTSGKETQNVTHPSKRLRSRAGTFNLSGKSASLVLPQHEIRLAIVFKGRGSEVFQHFKDVLFSASVVLKEKGE
jgi:hypothetical protein